MSTTVPEIPSGRGGGHGTPLTLSQLRSRAPGFASTHAAEELPRNDNSPTNSTFSASASTSRLPIRSGFVGTPTGKLSIRSDPSIVTCFDPQDRELYDLWAPRALANMRDSLTDTICRTVALLPRFGQFGYHLTFHVEQDLGNHQVTQIIVDLAASRPRALGKCNKPQLWTGRWHISSLSSIHLKIFETEMFIASAASNPWFREGRQIPEQTSTNC